MTIKTGCDIVHIPRFGQLLERTPDMKARLFTARELGELDIPHLAGIFAAKEAAVKALGMRAGDWQAIEVLKNADGRPELHVLREDAVLCDVSISHDGEYAFAVAVFVKDA